jgi:hypothetical protein
MQRTSSEQLQALSQKILFISQLSADFESHVQDEITKLHILLDKVATTSASEQNLQASIEHIKDLLAVHYEQAKNENNDLSEQLEEHKKVIKQLQAKADGPQKDELINLFFSDLELPQDESFEQYKIRLLKLELERRKAFKEYLDDIASAIQEGDYLELEAFLEEQTMEEAAERLCDDGHCQDEECFNCNDQAHGADADTESEIESAEEVAKKIKDL